MGNGNTAHGKRIKAQGRASGECGIWIGSLKHAGKGRRQSDCGMRIRLKVQAAGRRAYTTVQVETGKAKNEKNETRDIEKHHEQAADVYCGFPVSTDLTARMASLAAVTARRAFSNASLADSEVNNSQGNVYVVSSP